MKSDHAIFFPRQNVIVSRDIERSLFLTRCFSSRAKRPLKLVSTLVIENIQDSPLQFHSPVPLGSSGH